jgi:arginyl-tRNA synthetase
VVEPPRDAAHGDVTTNAAMVLAKPAGAAAGAGRGAGAPLGGHPDIAAAEVAGPGFVNLTLEASFWPKVLKSVLGLGSAYGRSRRGGGLEGQRRIRLRQPHRARCTSGTAAARCSATRWPLLTMSATR